MIDHNLSRREIIRLMAGGTVALALPELLGGCGGGGTESSASLSQSTMTVSGTANASQIGGTGLTVQSAYQSNAPVAASGALSTTVSASGAQLLTVTDNAGALRALALSSPSGTPLVIDATSTALSLVFLSPGIMSTDPDISSQRISQIVALPSFSALVSYLETNLPTSSIDTLTTQTKLDTLKTSCVTDWYNGNKATQPASVNSSSSYGFQATIGAVPPYIDFQNRFFRCLTVVRLALDAGGNPVADASNPAVVPVGQPFFGNDTIPMSGAMPLDWGSLFTFTFYNPATASDNFDPRTLPGAATLQYWVYGLGDDDDDAYGAPEPPPNVRSMLRSGTGLNNPVGLTILVYVVAPILDIVVGQLKFIKNLYLFVSTLWANLQPFISVTNLVLAMKEGPDAIAREALNFAVDLINGIHTVLQNAPLAESLGLVGENKINFLSILEKVTKALSIGNLIALAIEFWASPTVTVVEVPVSSLNVVVSRRPGT